MSYEKINMEVPLGEPIYINNTDIDMGSLCLNHNLVYQYVRRNRTILDNDVLHITSRYIILFLAYSQNDVSWKRNN